MGYDLVIKNGRVLDPAQGLNGPRDVAVEAGRVAAVAPNLVVPAGARVLDADNLLVTPGLIDAHTHVAEAIMDLAVHPDDAGVRVGVTAVSDAGSTGYVNFDGFRHHVPPKAQTDVFCFLHLFPVGQAVVPEIALEDVRPDETLRVIQANREFIRGIKVRGGANVVQRWGVEAIKMAKEVGRAAGLPVAVHLGIGLSESIDDGRLEKFTRQMLDLLTEGDLVVHPYTHRRGGVIHADGRILPEFAAAVRRGVLLDVAPGSSHFSLQRARIALDHGLLPGVITTDSVRTNIPGPVVFSLPVIMSKFLALGLDLDTVIRLTTVSPARVLGEEKVRGSLAVGRVADLSLLELREGDYLFFDGNAGNTLAGKQLLIPRITIKGGTEIRTAPRFRNYVPGESITFPKGT
jgi:dihydroorotase